jgi:hypothetical protein
MESCPFFQAIFVIYAYKKREHQWELVIQFTTAFTEIPLQLNPNHS